MKGDEFQGSVKPLPGEQISWPTGVQQKVILEAQVGKPLKVSGEVSSAPPLVSTQNPGRIIPSLGKVMMNPKRCPQRSRMALSHSSSHILLLLVLLSLLRVFFLFLQPQQIFPVLVKSLDYSDFFLNK